VQRTSFYWHLHYSCLVINSLILITWLKHCYCRGMLVTGASRVNVHVSFCDNYLIQFFCVLGGMNPEGGGVLNKVLYGEAPSRGPTPYPFIYHFWPKRYPFRIPFIEKWYPFHIPNQKHCIPFLNPWNAVNERHCERTDANQKLLSTRNILIKGPFKYLNGRFPYPFIYFNSWNPYPFVYLKPEKGTPFGRSLHV